MFMHACMCMCACVPVSMAMGLGEWRGIKHFTKGSHHLAMEPCWLIQHTLPRSYRTSSAVKSIVFCFAPYQPLLLEKATWRKP